jgi:hypothetical protein
LSKVNNDLEREMMKNANKCQKIIKLYSYAYTDVYFMILNEELSHYIKENREREKKIIVSFRNLT